MVLIKIEALKKRIRTLEIQLGEKKRIIEDLREKYKRLREQYDSDMLAAPNKSELEALRIENGQLKAKINSLKKSGRHEAKVAVDKLAEIQRILNYNPKK